MKNLSRLFFAIFTLGFLMTSCNSDNSCDNTCPSGQIQQLDCSCYDPSCGVSCDEGYVLTADCECIEIGGGTNREEVTANITSDATWTSDKIWVLAGRITVESGATLTIEPGTIVKGRAGAEANATALLVARGGKIMAEGTANSPIIFTSIADDIQPGQIESPNLPVSQTGLWGGVIICGRAPISADADAVQIEGIPPSDQNGLYGGTVADDNSGVLTYVSIRHGGTDIGEGNEINGLTLGGVGSGTTIDHVEVVSNVDDGVEFFGGTVNATNLIVWNQGDDAIDCDQAFMGSVEGFVTVAGANSDHALELDGPEGARLGSFTIRKGSCIGWNDEGKDGGEYADLRDGVTCTIDDVYFMNFSDNSDFEFDNEGVSMNYTNGDIVLSSLAFNVSHLSEGNLTVEDIVIDKSGLDAFAANPADASIVTSRSGGMGAAQFDGWSLTAVKGMLSGF
jgi:hypothetical protein